MKKQCFSAWNFAVVLTAFTMLLNLAAAGASEKPIVRFIQTDGSQPQNGLVSDGKGNFYGVTAGGGNSGCFPVGCGVVFELSPASNGAWTKKTIYSFKGGAADTAIPSTDLIFDAKGNLFGATWINGNFFGAIFELTPGAGGVWTLKILYRFDNQGYDPGTHLAFDNQGNLYGSVFETFDLTGGVFELSPQSNGTWKESLIYTFTRSNGDGLGPRGGVVLDGKGNVFGTTTSGGTSNAGTVFELSPNGSGGFAETIIYNFNFQDTGASPFSPLSVDAKGNLFGSTSTGGTFNTGAIFELSQSGGKWSETVLYSFGVSPDGWRPSGVVFDAKGNLYGTTANGGLSCNYPGCGIVFKLTPQTGGSWKETIVYNFESAADGSESVAGVLVDGANGRLYGTTQYGGGRYGNGTVFEIQP
jgi:uncharacterized repeat protein (TIGR03803 family)